MSEPPLTIISDGDLPRAKRELLDAPTLAATQAIVDDVKARGAAALREYTLRFGEMKSAADPLLYDRRRLDAALAALPLDQVGLLERVAARIRAFAEAQRSSLRECEVALDGGRAGHTIAPISRVGCYAPGGRYPLPSSVLMTAVTARVAGVESVVVASPNPAPVTLAAAAVAGADALLPFGGAHAVAALAYGFENFEPCDMIVGPGNRWVTSAKKIVSGDVGIDMLAGPSELLIIADDSADPALIAADLLAQAEHDDDALPMLVSLSPTLPDKVNAELARQLETLPTAATARNALRNGFCRVVRDGAEAAALCNRMAPEHLEVMTAEPDTLLPLLKHYGALFIGSASAEVFGDYGAGPNHVLPTGGGARSSGGLSVLTFLRVRTWLRLDARPAMVDDFASLARLEGLEAHARATRRK